MSNTASIKIGRRGYEVGVKKKRLSKSPEAALERFFRRKSQLIVENYELAICDWSLIGEINRYAVHHLSDGLLGNDGQPVFHLMMDRAIQAFYENLSAPRWERLVTWIEAMTHVWEDLPGFELKVDGVLWRCDRSPHLSEILTTRSELELQELDSQIDPVQFQTYLLQPWPALALKLGLEVFDE